MTRPVKSLLKMAKNVPRAVAVFLRAATATAAILALESKFLNLHRAKKSWPPTAYRNSTFQQRTQIVASYKTKYLVPCCARFPATAIVVLFFFCVCLCYRPTGNFVPLVRQLALRSHFKTYVQHVDGKACTPIARRYLWEGCCGGVVQLAACRV